MCKSRLEGKEKMSVNLSNICILLDMDFKALLQYSLFLKVFYNTIISICSACWQIFPFIFSICNSVSYFKFLHSLLDSIFLCNVQISLSFFLTVFNITVLFHLLISQPIFSAHSYLLFPNPHFESFFVLFPKHPSFLFIHCHIPNIAFYHPLS